MLDRRLIKNFDWLLFLIIIALAGISIANMYSATYFIKGAGGVKIFKRHVCWYAISLIMFFFMLTFDYHVLKKWGYHIYFVSIFLLLLVLIWGKITAGSQRWFRLGALSFQPSELAKLSVAIILSYFLSEVPAKRDYGLKDIWQIFLLVIIPAALILKEPDLGTAIIILIFSCTVILFLGMDRRSILVLVCAGLVIAPMVWMNLKVKSLELVIWVG